MKKQLIFISVCILISIITLLVTAELSKFRIGEFDGLIYQNIITPLLGLLFYFLVFKVINKSTHVGLTLIFFLQMTVFLGLHYYIINYYRIGGDYHEEDSDNYRRMTISDLFKKLNSKNTNISWASWEEIKRRENYKKGILIRLIEYREKNNPQGYIDEIFVTESIGIYSKNKNEKIKPYLYKMLASEMRTDLIETGVRYEFYDVRFLGKKLLKEYFNEEVDVVYKVKKRL